jgi:hypothetical protein
VSTHVLRLYADTLAPKASFDAPLKALNRVIYVVSGMAPVSAEGASAALAANSAFHSAGEARISAGNDGASLLRYELSTSSDDRGEGSGAPLLEASLTLDSQGTYLMRCDRVDIPPGGTAYTHTHQGPGIRCLLEGGFNVEVHGKTRTMAEGEAWFEAGPDPVLAWAGDDAPGNFSRVMILPRECRGKSSLRYVNAEDADKPKLQKYTIFIDQFIDI